MGLVTIEAMACGTPAIVYDKTAVPEVVTEKSGFVVESENGVSRVLDIVTNKRYSLLSCKDCIENAANYNEKNMCAEYVALYDSLIN